MADKVKNKVETKDLVSLVNLINTFNDNLWATMLTTVGAVYSNDPTGTVLEEDTYIDSTTNNERAIVLSGIPIMPEYAQIGVNCVNSGTYISRKWALPARHLRTLAGKGRQYFTLKLEDIVDPNIYPDGKGALVTADDVYRACYQVLHRLISIRPIYVTWIHNASGVGGGYGVTGSAAAKGFTVSHTYYGVYLRKDLDDEFYKNVYGEGKSYTDITLDPANMDYTSYGEATSGSFSKFDSYARGADFSIFSALDETLTEGQQYQAVNRNKCVAGVKCLATNINKEIQAFWNAWTEKCKDKNKFTYTYHSCHISCHSSCWCYGSRGRR